MSNEGGSAPDRPTVSTRVDDPPTISVRAATPERTADVISHGRRDGSVLTAVAAWRRRPTGRLAGAATLILLALALTGVGAARFVPRAVTGKAGPAPSAASASALPPSGGPEGGQLLPTDTDTVPPTAGGPLPINTVRPGDLLAAWATPLATKIGIPVVALQAYGYAELVAKHNQPACQLTWSTLAGIGKIESDHGRAQGATLQPNGASLPSIIGLPLDGQSGRKSIPDTDGGVLDTDRSWDRAVGPMQFIPSTWKHWGIDADGNGEIDINNIYDASLAAADYLCADGRDLSTSAGWHAAIASYNAVSQYIEQVFTAANDYGRRSRS